MEVSLFICSEIESLSGFILITHPEKTDQGEDSPLNNLLGVGCGILAINQFAGKSDEEKTLDEYLEKIKQQSKTSLHFRVNLYGECIVALVLNFSVSPIDECKFD